MDLSQTTSARTGKFLLKGMKCVMDLILQHPKRTSNERQSHNDDFVSLHLIKNIRFIKKTYQNIISRIFPYLFRIICYKGKIKK